MFAGGAGGDIFSALSGNISASSGGFVRVAFLFLGIIGLVYCAFSLRRYLMGEGRGDKEFLKLITGTVISILLVSASIVFFES